MTTATASPSSGSGMAATGLGLLPGFGGLLGKELTEWRRSRRTWIVLIVSGLFMTLSALNTWLQANVLPEDPSQAVENPIVDPLTSLAGAVSSQIFVVAAVFAVMGLIVTERESGTLAWTASKPVSRTAIWLAKLASSAGVLWIAAGLIPFAATVALVVALYGPVPMLPILTMGAGIVLAITLYVAVALATSTVITSQAAVAAIAIGVMFLPQLLGLVMPIEALPTSVLQWALFAAAGEPAGLVTPIGWATTMVVLVAVSLHRMERMEL
jgi:ABC-type transport system involved in multi-copper enzyme maturation permease subunit